MKILKASLFFLTLSSALLIAETKIYTLKVTYYMGFSGAGPKFRRETVYTQMDGKEAKVAEKIILDETNELREMYYVNPEGQIVYVDEKEPKEREAAEKFFRLARPEFK